MRGVRRSGRGPRGLNPGGAILVAGEDIARYRGRRPPEPQEADLEGRDEVDHKGKIKRLTKQEVTIARD